MKNNFDSSFAFAEIHMPAVRESLGDLPSSYFLDFKTASPRMDMQEATDLVLDIPGGTMAVRIRSNKFWKRAQKYGPDRSVRYRNNGHKTEIDKLLDGFGDWYFYGYSADDKGKLAAFWLIDLALVRDEHILERKWTVHPNGDGTSGMYIPIKELDHCIMYESNPSPRQLDMGYLDA